MAPHSITLASKIPWMEEPGGLQSMGLQRIEQHNEGVNSLHREARGPQEAEKLNLKWQTFFFFLILCCHDYTWFHLNLTFLKTCVNQCSFLMKCFSKAMLMKLCICFGICLSSNQIHLRLTFFSNCEAIITTNQ